MNYAFLCGGFCVLKSFKLKLRRMKSLSCRVFERERDVCNDDNDVDFVPFDLIRKNVILTVKLNHESCGNINTTKHF